MERKTARLTVLVDPEKKKAFEQLCARQDLTPSQVVRQLIRDYLADHGVSYGPAQPDGSGAHAPAVVNPVAARRTRGAARRNDS
ncbi:MAG TPA: ribbon-helix-helix protein, CopG family [Burkholderiaceae bacterium]|nr:ribbon-helix-helix protein, CopG family [Burkholderiaceae bacterium]